MSSTKRLQVRMLPCFSNAPYRSAFCRLILAAISGTTSSSVISGRSLAPTLAMLTNELNEARPKSNTTNPFFIHHHI
nr:hypothetical protein [Providencia rettgeri]